MKAARAVPLIAVLAAALYVFPAGESVDDFGRSIPKTIGAWEARETDRVFDRTTLYDYMDGGAEVFLAFDFREVWSRRYAGPDGGTEGRELTLDIYDMGSPAEAFGIFSCDREDPEAGIGQESEAGFGLLRFWQGRYFVTVTAAGDDETSQRAVLDVGRTVVGLLGPPGPKPDLIGYLPAGSLRADRTSFFHSNVNLNNRYFVASENILGLDRSTDCVFAEYDAAAGEAGCLLIVRYPDAAKAEAARRSFLAAYLPEAGAEGLARTENKKWVLALRKEAVLVVVFEAPDPDWARTLASSVPSFKSPSR